MEVGRTYIINDGLGYDKVKVLKKADETDIEKYLGGEVCEGFVGVVVEFLDEPNRIDLVFETIYSSGMFIQAGIELIFSS